MADPDPTAPLLGPDDSALAERLVAAGRLSRAQLDECLAQRPATPGRLLDLLVARGLVDSREIDQTDVTPHGSTAPVPGSTPSTSSRAPARIAQYEVLGELGRGGMGVVYRARDPALNRDVAIKTLHRQRASDEALTRFKREAEATAQLRHPGIVAVHEVGEHEGDMFVVLELVDGEPLEEVLRREAMPPRRAAELARSIALALEHVHERGIVHRDVKPTNILVERDGNPRLLDFGLARIADDSTQLTRPGDVLGTPAYMAPEQARGDIDAQRACTDIYGLGAVLYRALTGRPPHQSPSAPALFYKVMNEEVVAPRSRNADVPVDLDTIVVRCLAKDPARRYARAGDVAADLTRWLAGQPIVARPLGPAERARRWLSRHRVLAASAIAVAAVTLALVAWTRLASTERAREAERAERRAAVRAILEPLQAGEDPRLGVQATIDALSAWHDEDTVHLLAAALDATSDVLAAVTRETYRSAQPTAEEARAGLAAIEGLDEALDAPGPLDQDLVTKAVAPADVRRAHTLRLAERRLEARLEASAALRGPHANVNTVVGAAQSQRLGPGGERLARVVCEALGRIGRPERAVEALSRYLRLERDEPRAACAGEALARLGTDDGRRLVLACARERFGRNGLFWSRVSALLDVSALPDLERRDGSIASVSSAAVDRANLLVERGEHAAAIAELERALANDPSNPELFSQRGLARSHQGDLEGALADLSQAIDLDPRVAGYHSNRSWIRCQRRDFDGALADATRAIELDGQFTRGWLNRGCAHRARGDLEGAVADLSRALELDPSDTLALYNRGSALGDQGDVAGALRDLGRALELRPDFADALVARSTVNRQRGAMTEALADADRAVELAPRDPRMWIQRAGVRLTSGDLDGAIVDCDRALELDARAVQALSMRGGARGAKGDRAGGIADLTSALAIDPRYSPAIGNRATLRAKSGDLDGAIADFTSAIELDPRVPERWVNRGTARLGKGDLDDAIADFTRAIELRPTLATAWTYRGFARRDKGDVEGAMSDLRRSIELAPRAPGAQRARDALAELEAKSAR